jgi:orotate phosphoribosyltransferase
VRPLTEPPAEPIPPALEVAQCLLRIGAVTLSPREPYTWASGVRSPIYCDNRRLLSFPAVRSRVADLWAQLLLARYPGVETLAGVATAGIPHAALLAERLAVPMVYVRSSAKDHGLGRAVEGMLTPGSAVVVVEDLFSTGGSALAAVGELRKAQAQVLGATAIMTYDLPIQRRRFQEADLRSVTLTDLASIKEAALGMEALSKEELDLVDRGISSVNAQLESAERGGP